MQLVARKVHGASKKGAVTPGSIIASLGGTEMHTERTSLNLESNAYETYGKYFKSIGVTRNLDLPVDVSVVQYRDHARRVPIYDGRTLLVVCASDGDCTKVTGDGHSFVEPVIYDPEFDWGDAVRRSVHRVNQYGVTDKGTIAEALESVSRLEKEVGLDISRLRL